ncbi:hypothetical protein HPB50_003977 [Hyalomma asiaticum]|uniref:Uncharacterized protein n=1 Tax=Hyalomma asiaticum TaxID=266040 RepID=A0ACB7T7U6_HYAAI|nr:hypothetical protein HPB50_003977 [Hyalomma asiaticum]
MKSRQGRRLRNGVLLARGAVLGLCGTCIFGLSSLVFLLALFPFLAHLGPVSTCAQRPSTFNFWQKSSFRCSGRPGDFRDYFFSRDRCRGLHASRAGVCVCWRGGGRLADPPPSPPSSKACPASAATNKKDKAMSTQPGGHQRWSRCCRERRRDFARRCSEREGFTLQSRSKERRYIGLHREVGTSPSCAFFTFGEEEAIKLNTNKKRRS